MEQLDIGDGGGCVEELRLGSNGGLMWVLVDVQATPPTSCCSYSSGSFGQLFFFLSLP
jgi:hypothetical protein